MRKQCLVAWALFHASAVLAQDLPRGQVIEEVKCAGDPTQSYALYLPSNYSRDRTWNLLVGFHPAARGRAMVDTYRAAAEKYGYIVAGSNNARNGPTQVSIASLKAMSADLDQRVSIDANRVYLTGLSGGARVALQVALGSKQMIAGVIASSAGYPDSQRRKSLSFVLFGTAGTEDFNYIELRMLDRALTTPHRLAIFQGGHTLPPEDVALEAIEWLELQAMRSGRKTRDEALIDQLFDKRQRAVAASTSPATVHLFEDLARDFGGLRDVSAATARSSELSKQKDVKSALAREREDDDAEARQLDEVLTLEAGLRDAGAHMATLGRLRDWLSRTARQASAVADSPERQRARRVLRAITTGAGDRVQDDEYLKLIQQYRQPGAGRGAR